MTTLPDRLTVCLWDFSWYVRTAPGAEFADLDRACRETVERGFNTVRICAMPFLLFGTDLDTTALRLGPLPHGHGRGMRWYDVPGETTIDARAHLLALFEACRRHGLWVIVSSWEYQQSPSFARDPAWFEALHAVDPEERPVRLAEAEAALLAFLGEHGLAERVLSTELHNEVATGYLTEGLEPETLPDGRPAPHPLVAPLHDRLARGVRRFHELTGHARCAVNYSQVPLGAMRAIPAEIDVLVCHPYLYGVLGELIDVHRLRAGQADADALRAARLVRPDAPAFDPDRMDAELGWAGRATIICHAEMFCHDHVDAAGFDGWLYAHYGEHARAMRQQLTAWLTAARDWCLDHDAALVFGEGWVGYTPAAGDFEEGPVGQAIIREAMELSAAVGAWGTMVCSNAAPQHRMWADRAFLTEANKLFADSPAPVTLRPSTSATINR